MTHQSRTIRIFVGYPEDVKVECNALAQVVDEHQKTLGFERNLSIQLLQWETHSFPGMGDIQNMIDQQIGEYDIFVGVFWKRYGNGGTIKEFNRAYSLWKKHKKPHIMVYFCERKFFPATLTELREMEKVMNFRNAIDNNGLVWTFKKKKEFIRLTNTHLYRAIINVVEEKIDQSIQAFNIAVQKVKEHQSRINNLTYEEKQELGYSISDAVNALDQILTISKTNPSYFKSIITD